MSLYLLAKETKKTLDLRVTPLIDDVSKYCDDLP